MNVRTTKEDKISNRSNNHIMVEHFSLRILYLLFRHGSRFFNNDGVVFECVCACACMGWLLCCMYVEHVLAEIESKEELFWSPVMMKMVTTPPKPRATGPSQGKRTKKKQKHRDCRLGMLGSTNRPIDQPTRSIDLLKRIIGRSPTLL